MKPKYTWTPENCADPRFYFMGTSRAVVEREYIVSPWIRGC